VDPVPGSGSGSRAHGGSKGKSRSTRDPPESVDVSGGDASARRRVGTGAEASAVVRFLTVRSKDEAPEFFGRETRYGHRVYGGVLINLSR
jgi:hypothetical protein